MQNLKILDDIHSSVSQRREYLGSNWVDFHRFVYFFSLLNANPNQINQLALSSELDIFIWHSKTIQMCGMETKMYQKQIRISYIWYNLKQKKTNR